MKRKKRGKKKVIVIFAILLIVVLIVSLIIFLRNKEDENIDEGILIALNDNLVYEVNSEVKINSIIKSIENGILVDEEELLDTSKIGKKEVKVKVLTEDNKKEDYTFYVEIVDTQKPTIECNDVITITKGQEINLLDNIVAKDNYDEELKIEIVGEYDVNTASEYNLKFVVTDSSDNKSEKEFKLVVEEPKSNNVKKMTDKTITTSKGYTLKIIDGFAYIDGIMIANKTYSLPSNYAPGLQSVAEQAFNNMKNDASSLGYNFSIGSGYRSYSTQVELYNNYIARDGQVAADTYSARPGHSEHQTGLVIDICDNNELTACVNSAFDNTNQARWIADNCYKYGFIVRYPKGKDSVTGYMYESWHLRYVGVELAEKLYNNGDWLTLEEYYGITSEYAN